MLLSRFRSNVYHVMRASCYHGNRSCRYHGNRLLHTSPVLRSDYYKLLGVERNVTDKHIKAAYFGLAKKCHPDVSDDAESKRKFQEISAAYAILSNEKTRREYDLSLEDQPHYEFKSDIFREQTAENIFRAAFGENFDDLLAGRFGYTTGKENHREYRVAISMKEAALGAEKYFEVNTYMRCNACQGKAYKDGVDGSRHTCERCLGGGEIYNPQPDMHYDVMNEYNKTIEWICCPDCNGRGYCVTAVCPICSGVGRRTVIQWHPCIIPPGVQNGQLFEIPGVERGSTFTITVNIIPDYLTDFSYDEDGFVHSNVEILYPTAVEGGTVIVQTLFGDDELVIPQGMKAGTKLVLDQLDPIHTYTVDIHIARFDRQTSWGYKLYLDLYAEEQRNNLKDTELRLVCKVVSHNQPTKRALFRRDLYRVTILPCKLWAISVLDSIYERLIKIPWIKKKLVIFDRHDIHNEELEPRLT